jgi:hypothetical protein
MNVWALNKDNAIRRLLHVLLDRFETDALAISGRWEKDGRAVGLYRQGEESVLAYIFTYGQETGRYGLHLEYPGENDLSASTQMVENLDLNHLIELLEVHFNLEPRPCG